MTVESEAAAAVKVGAGLLTHWQALAFAGMALVCGLSAGALYFYDKGHAAASIFYEKQIAEVNAKAQSDHDAQQAQIDAGAQSTQPKLAAKMDSINANLAVLAAQAKRPPVVFNPNCVLPPEQISAYNAIH